MLFGTPATWFLPAWVVASSTTNNSKVEREASYTSLIDRLVNRSAFRAESTMLSSNNSVLLESLRAFTYNPSFMSQGTSKRLKLMNSMGFALELMLGWLLRLYNQRLFSFPIVSLSLWALRCQVTRPFWTALQKQRLLYSRDWTEDLALDVGKRVEAKENYPSWGSRKVAMGAGDNLLIKFQTNFEGCRDEGDGNRAYLFINWFVLLLAASTIPADFNPMAGRY